MSTGESRPSAGAPLRSRVACERFVAAEREVQALARIQPLGEDFVEAVDRVRRFGAEALARALDAEALAGPGLAIGVARADEQGEAFGIGRVEQARRLGLGESGQVVEVVVLPVGVFDVPRAHRDGRGREQRERSRGQLGEEALAALGENRWIERLAHRCNPASRE